MVQITSLLRALVIVAPAVLRARSTELGGLIARQSIGTDPTGSNGTSPDACDTGCQVLENISTCDDNSSDSSALRSCLCTSSIGQNLVTCQNCLISAGAEDKTSAQGVLDSWNQACGGNLKLDGSGSSGKGSGASRKHVFIGMVVGLTSAAVGSFLVL
ncbi:hypothetical protein BJ138DRAFT_534923 [Hygrophoropsis aurantiaca]|uniref:Uncharacterized protein n=1 Tax=Hygrophoropsis aurantiaca TaxID=72124 RepID=A0ACB8A1A2_9AGAM|nr:hypothetical protein BJ138DRAFT_534923 [Hygrophoropsis aurantiaca]